MWKDVENVGQAIDPQDTFGFPQVFHTGLWKEKWLFNKTLRRFYTYSQGPIPKTIFLNIIVSELVLVSAGVAARREWEVR
jgi:hypothetical protein